MSISFVDLCFQDFMSIWINICIRTTIWSCSYGLICAYGNKAHFEYLINMFLCHINLGDRSDLKLQVWTSIISHLQSLWASCRVCKSNHWESLSSCWSDITGNFEGVIKEKMAVRHNTTNPQRRIWCQYNLLTWQLQWNLNTKLIMQIEGILLLWTNVSLIQIIHKTNMTVA